MALDGPRLGLALGIGLLCAGAPARTADLNPAGLVDFGGSGAGVPVLDFLKLPSSARGVGMGAASLTTDEEASALQANPALLGLVQDYYYAVSHAEILGEFRHENLAFTWPTARFGGFGGSARILAATDFEDARDIDEVKTSPSAYDIALGFSYGNSFLNDHIDAGARLDLIRSSLDGDGANGYALSAGLAFMMVHDLRLAATLNNLSHGIRYDGTRSPSEPLPLSLGVELGKPLLDTRWSGQVGLDQGNDGIAHFYAGAEWRLIKYLVLRAGYEGSDQDRRLGGWAGFAAGLGIKYDRLTLDYGYKTLGPLGDYHAFSLSYSRKSKLRARDEILLERALEKYGRGKYAGALALARAAVAYNPYNFKAQALAQKIQLEQDRRDEMAVTIAYTANTEGRVASEWRGGKSVGGLPRRKTRLAQLKGAEGKILILDAGDLTRTGSDPEKEKFVYGAYARMPYDAVNIGRSEVLLPANRRDARLPFLSSQAPLAGTAGLLTEKVLTLKHGAEVVVLGAMDPEAIPGDALADKKLEAVAEAVRRRAGKPRQGRILVLLLHGSLSAADKIAKLAPELGVIILSGEAQALGSPMKSGNTLICSPGKDAALIGELTLLLERGGEVRSFRHSLYKLDSDVPEDEDLKRFLEPVTLDPARLSLDRDEDEYLAQVMAYVRSAQPDAGGSVYLRDLRTGKEYPVPAPDSGMACSRPILGFGRNRVAFQCEDRAGVREIYAYEPGVDRLDTLTRMGGRAGDMRWFLHDNALLAVYEKDGHADLYRIDPWNHEVRDLTGGRLGAIRGFDVDKTGERLVLNAEDAGASTLWITNTRLDAPVAIASDKSFPGSPRWSPDGTQVAFLAATDSGVAELRVFDLEAKALIKGTRQSRVRDFSWSVDGERIFYAAGVNLGDINALRVDSMTLEKVTAASTLPRNEAHPVPKLLGGRDGILFEASVEGARRILWTDRITREEKVLADSAACNSLE